MACNSIESYDFSVRQGDDKTVTFRYKADGLPVDLTGYVITFECEESTFTQNALIPLPTTGEFSVVFSSTDTSGLLVRRSRYEVATWPSGLTGTKETIFEGSINFNPEVVL